MEGQSGVAELYMAGRIKREQGLTWRAYGSRLNEYFRYFEHLFTPDLIIVSAAGLKVERDGAVILDSPFTETYPQ